MNWNADLYESHHSFVWRNGGELLDLLAPESNERILDVGCGTGHLTNRIAEAGASVLGIDNSAPMIDQARIAFPQLDFAVADIRDFDSAQAFDAVFSNAVLHWVRPPEQAAMRMFQALRPGGRLIVEFGGKGNIAALIEAAREILAEREPQVLEYWYFPGIGEYASLLETIGFEVVFCQLFDRPTPLNGGESGLRNWLDMFGDPLRANADSTFVERLENRVHGQLFHDGVWRLDYRRLRVVAQRPV